MSVSPQNWTLFFNYHLLLNFRQFQNIATSNPWFFVTLKHIVPNFKICQANDGKCATLYEPPSVPETWPEPAGTGPSAWTSLQLSAMAPLEKQRFFHLFFDMICCVKLYSCQWYWRVVATFQLNSTVDSIKWQARSNKQTNNSKRCRNKFKGAASWSIIAVRTRLSLVHPLQQWTMLNYTRMRMVPTWSFQLVLQVSPTSPQDPKQLTFYPN